MSRSCERTNPGLWAQFLERRQKLGEPAPTPADWTSPAVSAWMDVRKAPKEPDRDYANREDVYRRTSKIRRVVNR